MGNPEASFMLGNLYVQGEGVPKDVQKAREWWEKAAAANDRKAQFNLGALYEQGQGVPRNMATAGVYYKKACKNGFQPGCDACASLTGMAHPAAAAMRHGAAPHSSTRSGEEAGPPDNYFS